MSMTVVVWLVRGLTIYALVGVVFALAFVWRGIGRIDSVAAEGTLGFKILVFPGCVALWPLLAARWMSGAQAPPDENNPHRRAARPRSNSSAAGSAGVS